MQYILTEKEFKELSERPSQEKYQQLKSAYELVVGLAVKNLHGEHMPCISGAGYCNDCFVVAEKEIGLICPWPAKKDFHQ